MKIFTYLSHLFDAFEFKGYLFLFANYFIGFFVLGTGIIANWLAVNNLQGDHYIIGAIGQFFFMSLYYFYEKQNNIVYKSNLGYIERTFWNLLKINAGGIGALFLTKFIAIKFLTIFIGFEGVLSFMLGALSHYFIRFVEKIMRIKEKELDDKINLPSSDKTIQSLDDENTGQPRPEKPR